jgi:hypothetical protein
LTGSAGSSASLPKPTDSSVVKYFREYGFEHIRIEPVIPSPQELLRSEKADKEFVFLVREGIALWDEMKDEA